MLPPTNDKSSAIGLIPVFPATHDPHCIYADPPQSPLQSTTEAPPHTPAQSSSKHELSSCTAVASKLQAVESVHP